MKHIITVPGADSSFIVHCFHQLLSPADTLEQLSLTCAVCGAAQDPKNIVIALVLLAMLLARCCFLFGQGSLGNKTVK